MLASNGNSLKTYFEVTDTIDMKKLVIFIALPLSFANAEPTFRYDERKDPNRETSAAKEVAPPPARPAYYDAYKKVKNAGTSNPNSGAQARDPNSERAVPGGFSSVSSSQVNPPPMPANISPEMQQQIHQQLQNVDPATLQKAQDQLQKNYLAPPPSGP